MLKIGAVDEASVQLSSYQGQIRYLCAASVVKSLECALKFHLHVVVICCQYAKNITYSVILLGVLPVSEETSGSIDRGRR